MAVRSSTLIPLVCALVVGAAATATYLSKSAPVSPYGTSSPGRTPTLGVQPDPDTLTAVSGKIRRSGSTAGLRDVTLELRDPEGKVYQARSGRDGIYRFDPLPSGSYLCTAVTAPTGTALALGTWILRGPTLSKDLDLDIGARLFGRIETHDRRPIDRVDWRLFCESQQTTEAGACPVDKDGSFQIQLGRASGKSAFFVSEQRYPPSRALSLDLGRKDVEGLELRFEAGGRIFGSVVDEAGRMVPGAQVMTESPDAISKATCVTDATGAFWTPWLGEGAYRIAFLAAGYVPSILDVPQQVVPGKETGPVVLTLKKGWTLRGTVTAAAGTPVSGATIEVLQRGARKVTESNASGGFVLEGLRAAEQDPNDGGRIDSVTCSAPGFSRLQVRNVDPRVPMTILLDRAGGIRITVKLEEGAVGPDFEWSATLIPLDPPGPSTPKPKGLTHLHQGPLLNIADVRPGSYDVTVAATGRLPFEVKRVVVQGSAVVQIDATLIKGNAPIATPGALDPMDVAQTVPRLREILKSLPEEQKEVLRKQIEKMVQLLDPGSAPRKAYEDLLKEP